MTQPDEAHRGSAKEDSQWRQILDYFSSAIQIGMTATPKELQFRCGLKKSALNRALLTITPLLKL